MRKFFNCFLCNKYLTAFIGANDYEGTPVITSLTMKNIRLESDTAAAFALYTGVLYQASYTINSATIENVTSVQNGEAKGVEAQKCNSGYNNVTFPDASKVTVTNTATATGYADPTVPPTGDMTAVYVAVALVSLAAVTVVVKKKITE